MSHMKAISWNDILNSRSSKKIQYRIMDSLSQTDSNQVPVLVKLMTIVVLQVGLY